MAESEFLPPGMLIYKILNDEKVEHHDLMDLAVKIAHLTGLDAEPKKHHQEYLKEKMVKLKIPKSLFVEMQIEALKRIGVPVRIGPNKRGKLSYKFDPEFAAMARKIFSQSG